MDFSCPVTILSMTLIVALECDEGIVLAGDKREHGGNDNHTFNDVATKITQLNDKVAIGCAGDGYDAQIVVDALLRMPSITTLDVSEVASIAYNIATDLQIKLLTDAQTGKLLPMGYKTLPKYGLFVVGYQKTGEPKVYSLTNTNTHPNEIKIGYAGIGVPIIAEYIFSKEYKKDLTLEDLGELARKSIIETSTISSAVSPICDLIKVPKPGD